MDEQGRFKTQSSRTRACRWLHFVVTGSPAFSHADLSIIKILCGASPRVYIAPDWNYSDKDRQMADDFLKQVIRNWDTLKNTSPDGLRSLFLQRNGTLSYSNANWHLRIDRVASDIVVDSLPYGLSIIKLPWMIDPLFVEW